MKLYARTNEKSYLNNFKGEEWAEVEVCTKRFPSGVRECVKFPSGYVCKVNLCEVVQVFDK